MLLTNGSWADRLEQVPSAQDALDLFLQLLDSMLQGGASCVAEYVVRTDQEWVIDRLRARGDCLVVMTQCEQAMARYLERARSEALLASPAVLAAVGHESAEEFALESVARMEEVEHAMMRDFSVPTLSVNTTAGYDPAFESIVGFATQPVA